MIKAIAIAIIAMIGIMDLVLIVACGKMEERERRDADR